MPIGSIILQELSTGWPDTTHVVRAIVRLVSAVLLGAMIGYERQRTGKPAGLRTHMLVSLGCALFVTASTEFGMGPTEIARVIQGIETGIGFIGAGAILKLQKQEEIKWLTTAADLWVTAAVGVAVGMGRIGVALVGALLTLFILEALRHLSHMMRSRGGEPPSTNGTPPKNDLLST